MDSTYRWLQKIANDTNSNIKKGQLSEIRLRNDNTKILMIEKSSFDDFKKEFNDRAKQIAILKDKLKGEQMKNKALKENRTKYKSLYKPFLTKQQNKQISKSKKNIWAKVVLLVVNHHISTIKRTTSNPRHN